MSERFHCGHCGLPVPAMGDDVPRCRKCNKPMCWPEIHDCAFEHYRLKHDRARKIEEVRPL